MRVHHSFKLKIVHEFECSDRNSICCGASSTLFMFIPMAAYYLYTSAFICRQRVNICVLRVYSISQRVEEKCIGRKRETEKAT